MLATYTEPSYPVTLIGFRDDFVRDEFAPLCLGKSFVDRGPGFFVEMNYWPLFPREGKNCIRQSILILWRKLTDFFNRAVKQFCHFLIISCMRFRSKWNAVVRVNSSSRPSFSIRPLLRRHAVGEAPDLD